MFPFMGLRQSSFSQVTLCKALDKLNKNELKVEDILVDLYLVNELKSYTYSQLMNFLTPGRLIEFVNYIINEPLSDEHTTGYLFPFNSCEILCSENVYVLNKLFENTKEQEDKEHLNKNNNETVEPEFSGRKSIIKPNYSIEDDKLEEFNDLDRDIVNPEGDSKESLENGVKHKIEEIADNVQEKDFLDCLEPKEDVLSVNKEQIDVEQNSDIAPPEYPVIDHLFTLLKNEGTLNYVLAGYFFKFFNHLTLFRNNIFLTYLLIHKTSFIFDMIKHLNRKSISDCLIKILVSYIPEIQDAEIKKDILEKVIESFDQNDEECLENICDLFSDILQNRRVYYLIATNGDLLSKIYEFVCRNLRDSTQSNNANKIPSFKILITFIEQVIRDFTPNSNRNVEESDKKDSEESSEFENYPHELCFRINSDPNFNVDLDTKNYLNIFNVIYSYLEPICKDFKKTPDNDSTYVTSFDKEIPKLGMHKIFEFEYIHLIFKLLINVLNNNNLNQFDVVSKNIDVLIDKFIDYKIFGTIVNYFFLYEWNSIYQNLYTKLVSFIVSSSSPAKLIDNFFIETKFIENILEHLFASGISFKSGSIIFPGNFANLCELIDIINKSENSHLESILSDCDEWVYISSIFIEPVIDRFNKGLLYTTNEVKSPFERRVSFSFKESSKENEEKVPQLKLFAADCSLRFDKMKLRKENQLREEEKFDIEIYFKEEEESNKQIEKEAEDLAISIQAEDLANSIQAEEFKLIQMDETSQAECNTGKYLDNNYFWKTYNVNVDLSEL